MMLNDGWIDGTLASLSDRSIRRNIEPITIISTGALNRRPRGGERERESERSREDKKHWGCKW